MAFKRVRDDWSKHRSQHRCICGQDFFCNGIGSAERTETQQVSGSSVPLSYALKGERPGGCHPLTMIVHEGTTLTQQFGSMGLVELMVVLDASSGGFQIRSCLIERQW